MPTLAAGRPRWTRVTVSSGEAVSTGFTLLTLDAGLSIGGLSLHTLRPVQAGKARRSGGARNAWQAGCALQI